MITDLEQSRIPKRKDRFKLGILAYLIMGAMIVLLFYDQSGDTPYVENLFLIFFVILFILSILTGIYQRYSWRTAWEHMAGQFGLTYELYQSKQSLFFRWPRISGNYRGRGMNMERFQLGSGRNARIYTRISLALNGSLDNWLEITPRSWSTSARNALPFKKNRLEPVSMNDESFDHKLEVRSQPEDFARNVLASSGLKSALLDLRGQARDMKVTIQADALSYQEQTTIKDAGYLGGVLDVLGELAVYVERYCR